MYEIPKVLTLYLAHSTVNRNKIRNWELEFEDKIKDVLLANPFYDNPFNVHDAEALDRGEVVNQKENYGELIVPRDLRFMRIQEGFLVVLDDKFTIGAHDERIYAKMFEMWPRIAICTDEKYLNHPWVLFHTTKSSDGKRHIYSSFEEFEADVENILKEWKERLKGKGFD